MPEVHTVAFGETRRVSWQSTISVGGALYSVRRAWSMSASGPAPTAPSSSSSTLTRPRVRARSRHALTTPGRPSILDEHYPPRPAGALERKPCAQTIDEQTFLAIGPGAESWLIAGAAAGTTKLRRKVAEAVALAKLHGDETVDDALQVAADAGRFGDGDPAAILAHQGARVIAFPARANEQQSLQRSTAAWEGFGA